MGWGKKPGLGLVEHLFCKKDCSSPLDHIHNQNPRNEQHPVQDRRQGAGEEESETGSKRNVELLPTHYILPLHFSNNGTENLKGKGLAQFKALTGL